MVRTPGRPAGFRDLNIWLAALHHLIANILPKLKCHFQLVFQQLSAYFQAAHALPGHVPYLRTHHGPSHHLPDLSPDTVGYTLAHPATQSTSFSPTPPVVKVVDHGAPFFYPPLVLQASRFSILKDVRRHHLMHMEQR